MTNYDSINKVKNSKKLKGLAAAALLLGLAVAGAQSAYADEIKAGSASPMSKVVAAISSKFNLNATEVQTVVDGVMTAERASMEAKMQAEAANRLTAAVTAGTVTQAQADLITAKAAEIKATMQAEREANKNLTEEQRKAKMEANKTALESWATTNGISKENLKFLGAGGMGKGPGKDGARGGPGMNGQGPRNGQTPTRTPAGQTQAQ